MRPTKHPNLVIARDHLREVLSALARLGGRSSRDEAVIGFADDELWIRAGGVETTAPATGHWPGEAVVTHAALRALSRQLPDGDPVTVRIDGDHLSIGALTVPCRWNEGSAMEVSLPMNADLRDLLLADLMYAEETLAASGVLKRVEDARAKREDLLDRATRLLAPLRISRDALAKLVQHSLLDRL